MSAAPSSLAPSNVAVRLAKPTELAAVGELLVSVYIGEGHTPPAVEPVLRDVTLLAREAELRVAVDERGALLGCVALTRSGGPYAEVAGADEAEMSSLAVAREARSRGTGAALVQACAARAREWGCARVVLSTQRTMAEAQRLYARLGFVRRQERDWTSPDGDARLVYTLALAGSGAVVSRATAEHYVWGGRCDGWRLVRTPGLSVIEERMPPGTSEVRHFHHHARQFFYVLSGELTLETEGVVHTLRAHEGLEVAPGQAHRAQNPSADEVSFLVISQPTTEGDRVPA